MTVVFLNVKAVTSFNIASMYGSSVYFGQLPEFLAILIATFEHVTTTMFYTAMFLNIGTKFLSIYFQTFIADLDENQSIFRVKSCVFGLPWLLVIVEYSLLTSVRDLMSYQVFRFGEPEKDAEVARCIQFLMMISLVSAITLQIKLEHNYMEHGENKGLVSVLKEFFLSKQEEENQNNCDCSIASSYSFNPPCYKINATRLVLVLGSFLAILIVVTMFQTLIFRYTVLVFHFVLLFLFPLIFILCQPEIKKHGSKLLSSFLIVLQGIAV